MKKLMTKIAYWKRMVPEVLAMTISSAKQCRSGVYGEHDRKHWLRIAYHDLKGEIEFAKRFINKITEGDGAE